MIISIDDFPTLPDDINALESAIAQTNALIQGQLGANRSLEVTDYIEVHPIASVIYPQMLPLVLVRKIWITGDFVGNFNLPLASNIWVEIPSTNYVVDIDYGEIRLAGIQLNRRNLASVKISYQSGFDFSVISPETQGVKSTATAIASELLNQVVANNIKSFEIDDEGHKTTYFGSNEGLNLGNKSSKIGSLLATFHKYQGGERFA